MTPDPKALGVRMNIPVVLLFVLACAALAAAQQAPTNKERYLRFLEQHHERLISEAQQEVANAEAGVQAIRSRKVGNRAEEQEKKIDLEAAGKRLAAARKDLSLKLREKKTKKYTWERPKLICDSGYERNYVGMIGPLDYGEEHGKSKAIRITPHIDYIPGHISYTYWVTQIIDADRMLVNVRIESVSHMTGQVRPYRDTQPVLMRGVATLGRADGQIIDLRGYYFEITGTYTYGTAAGGSKTVLVFERFDMTGVTP